MKILQFLTNDNCLTSNRFTWLFSTIKEWDTLVRLIKKWVWMTGSKEDSFQLRWSWTLKQCLKIVPKMKVLTPNSIRSLSFLKSAQYLKSMKSWKIWFMELSLTIKASKKHMWISSIISRTIRHSNYGFNGHSWLCSGWLNWHRFMICLYL